MQGTGKGKFALTINGKGKTPLGVTHFKVRAAASHVCATSLRLSELHQQLLEQKKKGAFQVKTAIFNLLIRSMTTCTPDKAPTRCLAVTPTQQVGRDLCVSQEMLQHVQGPKTPFYL